MGRVSHPDAPEQKLAGEVGILTNTFYKRSKLKFQFYSLSTLRLRFQPEVVNSASSQEFQDTLQ